MRVALLGPAPAALLPALQDRGVDAWRPGEAWSLLRPVEARLRRRLYEPGLTTLPQLELVLRRSEADLAHAFDPASALAAARWRRSTGRPAVFTLPDVPNFEWIRARRRRRELLVAALGGCSLVIAPSPAAAEALHWWLGGQASVVAEGDGDAGTYADGLIAVYAELWG